MRIVAVVLLMSGLAWGQGVPPAPRNVDVTGSVQAFPPDGGTDVNIISSVSITTDARVSTGPGETIGVAGPDGERLRTEVTGIAAGPVVTTVSGPVTLASESNELLAGIRPCTAIPIGHNEIDGGAYFEFVSAPGQTAISITAHNFNDVDNVCCFLGVADGGPYPNCVHGSAGVCDPIHNQGSLVQDGLTDSSRMRCLTCKHNPGPPVGTALVGGQISVCTPF